MNGISLVENAGTVCVRIPMKMKKRCGRKEIIAPDGLDGAESQRPDYQEEFVIALARAHRWQEMLDSGEYNSIKEMAATLGICDSYMRRLLRFTLLAPDIIEAIINGNEPDGFSQNRLIGIIPANWEAQRREWDFEAEFESQALADVTLNETRDRTPSSSRVSENMPEMSAKSRECGLSSISSECSRIG